MKNILFIFFILASLVSTKTNSETIFYLDGSSLTGFFGNVFIDNDSTPINVSPTCPEATAEIGPMSNTDWIFSGEPLNSTVAGDTTWTTAGYVYFSSIANGPVIFNWDNGSSSDNSVLRVLNNGKLRLIINGALGSDSVGTIITIGSCYYMWLSYDGSFLRAGASPADSIDSIDDVSHSSVTAEIPSSGTRFLIGTWSSEAAGLNLTGGFMSGIIHDDTYVITQPLTPPSEATTPSLSPYKLPLTERFPFLYPMDFLLK